MPRLSLSRCIAGLLIVAGLAEFARTENWPQWRGPRQDGVSTATAMPATWSANENVAWRLELPGSAGSTPVVWGDRIFLTSADKEDLVLICADTAGHQLWKQVVATGDTEYRKDEGNNASQSPSTDGQHVWAMFGTGDLACFDVDGKPVWKLNVQDRYGKFQMNWGFHSSPVLDGDKLYLQLIHSNGWTVVALDKLTGDEVWKQTRPSDARGESKESYSTPFVYRDANNEYLLTHGADYIVAHRLSDGQELWRCGGLNPKGKYNNSLRFVASPVAVPGLIVVPSAKSGPILGLSPDAQGDVTSSESAHVWTRAANSPDVPSPLVYDGLVYLCRENGVLYCVDAKTGEQLYEQRLHSDRYRASPLYFDGKVLCISRDGTATVVKFGREFEKLAENTLNTETRAENITSSPVIADGTLYLRTFGGLYAIRAAK
jgi:outer membrane protein assembly factor BamB